jgi:DNA repair protein RadA
MKLDELRDADNKLIFSLKQRENLELAGIRTVFQLATTNIRNLKKIDGIGDASIRKGLAKAREILGIHEFTNALELHKIRSKEVKHITTGSTEVDKILNGGIETRSMSELAGMNGAGKTQFCLQLCVNVQLSEDKGGLDGNALFIDTENTFRPERIMGIAEAMGLDPIKTAENVLLARAFTSDHQVFLTDNCDSKIRDENVKLLIVDGLMTHFRSEYIGRDALSVRQQKLNEHMSKLRKLMIEYKLAVVYTNQVISSPDLFGGTKAVGGNIVGHGGAQRIYIRRPKKSSPKRIIALRKSPYMPDAEAVFKITENGVEDAK